MNIVREHKPINSSEHRLSADSVRRLNVTFVNSKVDSKAKHN